MDFSVGQSYVGFKLMDKQNIEELNSLALILEHEKTGAKALLLSNDDENKVFSISFKTPPKDDTGLPHILEHSVLCGSKNFPVKDPFVELVKGSLNTFLNAMTFSDKTMYPIASCNDKDFQNLMHVYMDAVFYPMIYTTPEIFSQEGWHYEINNPDDDLRIKGVVYNEMKGVFSSPEQVLFRKIQQSLFPNTPYSKESGGDPEYIPDLTHEQFLDFHKTYYHPSNSYIYLYGDFDIVQKLQWLDKEYLSKFEKKVIDANICIQPSYESIQEHNEYYSITENENEQDKTYLSYNLAVGTASDTELYYAFQIIEYLLLEAPGAPVKQALIDANIGKDVFGSYDNSILQPTFSFIAKNANKNQKDQFIKVINNTLKELVENGIDKKSIESAVNYHEFKIREADYGRFPKGVIYSMMNLETWLYNEDPLSHFKYNKTFEKFRENLDKGYFESLIEKYLINNNHVTILFLEPKKGLTTEWESKVKEKLSVIKSQLSDDEIYELIQKTKHLEKYQSEETQKELLEKIPLLSKNDIKKNSEPLQQEVIDAHNIKILLHPIFTNNIGYVNLLFDTKHIPNRLIPYLGLLSALLGKMDTENYKYKDLSNEVNINTGGINYYINVYSQINDSDAYVPKFEIRGKAFYEKIPNMFELIKEILFNTKLDDKKRLYEIIAEYKSRLNMTFSSSGHLAASNRAMSYFSNTAYYQELTGGITFYKFINVIEENYEEKQEEIISNIKELLVYLFRRENLIVSYTAEKSAYGIFENEIERFVSLLHIEPIKEEQINLNIKKINEGYLTSDKIQYVAKAGNYIKEGFSNTGSLKVLQTIAGLDYLWNNVRVKGGAYGVMCNFFKNGNTYFTSYRDPNLKETIETYNKLYDYLKTFHADDRDMTKYIIGTISSMDVPLTPMNKGMRAVVAYLSNISYKDLQKEREEVLNTTDEDIRNLAQLVHKVLTQDNICVVGNENKLKENEEIFDELVPLFN